MRSQHTPVRRIYSSVKTYENLPMTYRRLVAKHTGDSFREVAMVVEESMIDPSDLDEGEVIVRVLYAGVNGGCETFRCRGEYAFAGNKNVQFVQLGAEGCGIVVASRHDDMIGRHVMFVGGAFSEYVRVRSYHPIDKSSKEMTAVRISGHVAYAALTYVGHMKRGDVVLVTAGAGATGSFAVQVAKECGCHVVATCRNSDKADILHSKYEVDRVINYSVENVEDILRHDYAGRIDIAYEGVGGVMQQLAWDALAPGGRLLSVGYISQYPHVHSGPVESYSPSLPRPDELFWQGKTVTEGTKTAYGNVWPTDPSVRTQALNELCSLCADGRVTPLVDDTQHFDGIESIPDAVDYMLQGNAMGKVVVTL